MTSLLFAQPIRCTTHDMKGIMTMKIRFRAALLLAALILLSGCAAEAASPASTQPILSVVEEPTVPLAPVPPTEAPASPTAAPTAPAPTESKQITREEAIAIALADAGLTEEQVVHRRAEFDYENGQPVYEVEFYSGDREYDYDIHAVTGQILFREAEPERTSKPAEDAAPASAVPVTTEPPATEAPQSDRISKEKAISIALADAGFSESQVSRLKAEFDYDDGRPEYEVEFRKDGWEYSYDIHAETGKILSKDKDWDD